MTAQNSSANHAAEKRYIWCVDLAICLAVLLIYWQTGSYEFLMYDDDKYVLENPHVNQGINWPNFVWAWTQVHLANWHPLTWMSHQLDCELFGLEPGRHHLTNLVVHALASVSLFHLLKKMTGDLWPSAFVAAAFAVHPQHVESVAWIAERKDLLSGLFFVWTLSAYVSFARNPFSLGRYLLVFGLYLTGLLCKPMLVTLPCVLLLLDFWPLNRVIELDGDADPHPALPAARRAPWFILIVEKIPLFVLTGVSCVITIIAQKSAQAPVGDLGYLLRFENAFVSYAAYIRQFLFPLGFNVLYLHPRDKLPISEVFTALLFLVPFTIILLLHWRYRFLVMGWLWFLGMLVPVIGIIQVGLQARADRYMYLPQIGLLIMIAWSARYVMRLKNYPAQYCWCGSIAALVLWIGCAFWQTQFWQNPTTIWERAVNVDPMNYAAIGELATSYYKKNDKNVAEQMYLAALKGQELNHLALNGLGRIYHERHDYDKASWYFQKSIEARPDFAVAHNNYGALLGERGDTQAAINEFNIAIELNADYADAWANLGRARAQLGETEAARAAFKTALAIKAKAPTVLFSYGDLLASENNFDGAIVLYQRAVAADPGFLLPYKGLAEAYRKKGDLQRSLLYYEKAVSIAPKSIQLNLAYGDLLVSLGRLPEGIARYNAVLEGQPDNEDAKKKLAAAQAKSGAPDESGKASGEKK